jgi:hypothetical protein
MKEKIRIKQKDKNRVLLTEVLPYETPIIFSNRLLYTFANASELANVTVPTLVNRIFRPAGQKYSIPYDYHIRQGVGKVRQLSLIHPANQLSIPKFYQSYDDLILSLCRRSRYSLRFPVRVASYFYTHEFDETAGLNDTQVDVAPSADEFENKYASSYFYYSKFNQLYKFIDSTEFLDLERRFTFLKRFDVKRCFASIYTHTLSWAVKGKTFAKEHKGLSFDSAFDQLMMAANYNETNGIVVGPEISRIFAEIILQQIDLNISSNIKEVGISDSEYSIRRYLDDYFLFTRNKDIEDKIHCIVERELQEYKLYLNESKTQDMTVPFATGQTIAKSDVQIVLNQSVLHWLAEMRRSIVPKLNEANALPSEVIPPQPPKLKTPFLSATQTIRDVKIALKRSDQGFNIISGYALSAIIKSCYRLQKRIKKHGFDNLSLQDLQNLLTSTIEIVFFLYSMDFRVRTTYLVSQFMLIIHKFGDLDPRLLEHIGTRIKNSVYTVLNSRSENDLGGIEVHNLLIALRSICPDENLASADVYKYFDIERKTKKSTLTYFDFIAIFYYTKSGPLYSNLRGQIQSTLKKKFTDADNRIAYDSELTLLLVDMLACPYVDVDIKNSILDDYVKHAFGISVSQQDKNQLINFFCATLNFTDWSNELDLEKLLVRKQLNPGY